MCEMSDVLEHPERRECVTCGHGWPREARADAPDAARVAKDARGDALVDGDCARLHCAISSKPSRHGIPPYFAPR